LTTFGHNVMGSVSLRAESYQQKARNPVRMGANLLQN
jgi:hypothetical protein